MIGPLFKTGMDAQLHQVAETLTFSGNTRLPVNQMESLLYTVKIGLTPSAVLA